MAVYERLADSVRTVHSGSAQAHRARRRLVCGGCGRLCRCVSNMRVGLSLSRHQGRTSARQLVAPWEGNHRRSHSDEGPPVVDNLQIVALRAARLTRGGTEGVALLDEAAAVRQRGGHTHPERATRRPHGRRRRGEPSDRTGPVRHRQDGRGPPQQHLPQAQRPIPKCAGTCTDGLTIRSARIAGSTDPPVNRKIPAEHVADPHQNPYLHLGPAISLAWFRPAVDWPVSLNSSMTPPCLLSSTSSRPLSAP